MTSFLCMTVVGWVRRPKMSLSGLRTISGGQVFPRGVVNVGSSGCCLGNSMRGHDTNPPMLSLHLPWLKKLKSVGGGSKRTLTDRAAPRSGRSSSTHTTRPNFSKYCLMSQGVASVGMGLRIKVALFRPLHLGGTTTAGWSEGAGREYGEAVEPADLDCLATGPNPRPGRVRSPFLRCEPWFPGFVVAG